VNLYGYVGNGLVAKVDPLGLQAMAWGAPVEAEPGLPETFEPAPNEGEMFSRSMYRPLYEPLDLNPSPEQQPPPEPAANGRPGVPLTSGATNDPRFEDDKSNQPDADQGNEPEEFCGKKDHVVLGLRNFAKDIGARHSLDDGDAWKDNFNQSLEDRNTEYSLRLDGLTGNTPSEQIQNSITRIKKVGAALRAMKLTV
jgi:hypothetical protein